MVHSYWVCVKIYGWMLQFLLLKFLLICVTSKSKGEHAQHVKLYMNMRSAIMWNVFRCYLDVFTLGFLFTHNL